MKLYHKYNKLFRRSSELDGMDHHVNRFLFEVNKIVGDSGEFKSIAARRQGCFDMEMTGKTFINKAFYFKKEKYEED